MQRQLIALVLSLPLVLVGCTTETAQPSEPVHVPSTATPSPQMRNAEEWEAEGRRLVGEESWAEAAHAYEEAAKQRPLADLWNEASHAYLMAKQYDNAIRTGESALHLYPKHAYALYNTGMGYLETAKPCEAIALLGDSEQNQGERWEISLALGRAYVEADLPRRALERLLKAIKLGAPSDAVARWQTQVEQRLSPPLPATLAQSGELLADDGSVRIYQQTFGGHCHKYWDEQSTWMVQGKQVERLDGPGEVEGVKVVTLPDGQNAYWVQGDFVGAGISRTRAHSLIVLVDSKPERFQFISPLHQGYGIPEVSDFVPSWSFPKITGDEMTTSETDFVAGLYSHHITWQIDPVARTATQVRAYGEGRIRVQAITPTTLTGRFSVSGYDQQDFSFDLSPDLQVRRAGQPATLADLQVGQSIQIQMQDWTIFVIDLAGR